MDVWTSGGNTSSRKEVFKGEMGVVKLNRNRRYEMLKLIEMGSADGTGTNI